MAQPQLTTRLADQRGDQRQPEPGAGPGPRLVGADEGLHESEFVESFDLYDADASSKLCTEEVPSPALYGVRGSRMP